MMILADAALALELIALSFGALLVLRGSKCCKCGSCCSKESCKKDCSCGCKEGAACACKGDCKCACKSKEGAKRCKGKCCIKGLGYFVILVSFLTMLCTVCHAYHYWKNDQTGFMGSCAHSLNKAAKEHKHEDHAATPGGDEQKKAIDNAPAPVNNGEL